MTSPAAPPPIPHADAVKAPAICLIALGGLAFALDAFGALMYAFAWPFLQELLSTPSIQRLFGRSIEESDRDGIVWMGSIGAALGLVTLAGGVQMLRRRTWWLGVVGAVLATVNCETCCCVVGLPVGVWALIVLFREDVRAQFTR